MLGTPRLEKNRIKALIKASVSKESNFSNCMAMENEIKQWKHLQVIEYNTSKEDKVELVIGLDHPQLVMPREVRCGRDGEPYAVLTRLGWTINGPVALGTQNNTMSCFMQAAVNQDEVLVKQVEKLWAMEDYLSLFSEHTLLSKEDQEVIELWDKEARVVDGHYVLPIPFKNDPPTLKNNFELAMNRLRSLKRKLLKDQTLLKMYNQEIDNFIKDGYAEKIKEAELNAFPGMEKYLPIFNVKNPNKPEKFRLVHDPKAEQDDESLNKMVKSGPNLVNKLIDILLRFRKEHVAVTADIKAMFFQVRVPQEHKHCLRFLWWPEGNLQAKPEVFAMLVHMFGGVWCPCAAMYALKRCATDQAKEFSPEAINAIQNDMYVDNLIHCLDQKLILNNLYPKHANYLIIEDST